MRKNLEILIVPSGSFDDDTERIHRAREYKEQLEEQGKEVKIIDSGIGPNLHERLKRKGNSYDQYFSKFESTEGLDVHPRLWNESLDYVKEDAEKKGSHQIFGVDTIPRNSRENMIYTFPRGTEGNYTIVSRRLHNRKFRLLEKYAREEGYLTKGLNIKYVNTNHKYSAKDLWHDVVSLAQTYLFGRKMLRKTIHDADAYINYQNAGAAETKSRYSMVNSWREIADSAKESWKEIAYSAKQSRQDIINSVKESFGKDYSSNQEQVAYAA